MAFSGCEPGISAIVVAEGMQVVKMSQCAYDTVGEAQQVADRIGLYAGQLGEGPLDVVPIRELGVQADNDGYRVRHVYDLIDGESLAKLTGDKRSEAVRRVLGQVADMQALYAGDEDTLAVPVDAKVQNFHIDPSNLDRPVLIDVYPALLRDEQGVFHASQRPGGKDFISWTMGTKSGMMAKMLFSSLASEARGKAEKALVAARKVDDWCYDVLPESAPDQVKTAVRRQLDWRFMPYIMRGVEYGVRQRLR